ncbi:flagellar biosynthesis protein FlhA [bacterium]|nr:flagellar biosynthesis protein FlhA [bacterium]
MATAQKAALPVPFSASEALKKFPIRGDIIFALGIIGILTVLLFPVPTWLLDFLLGLSITCSVVVLMTVVFVERPLDLNSFPTILLVVTMFRLSLNIASTRLILSHGHEGPESAGHIIQAFGSFVMGGSVVVGIIVFAILTLINFVVITKGSGRIAEVSARFSLDAMPGKQMAIDADLSAGLIDEETARKRRKDLEDENTFYGAMDGASKFVRGDAIAGLIITFINFIGGMIIGMVQRDITFEEALNSYTILTVGDGLVAQVPAIVVSIGAGMLVTKAGTKGSADKAVFEQLSANPKTMYMTSGVLASMAMIPALPATPFLILASIIGGFGFFSYQANKVKKVAEAETAAKSAQPAKPEEEPISNVLHIDALKLELGYGLLPLINYQKGHRLTEQIKALRKQIAREFGFVMSPVRIQDNMQLPANSYVLKVKDIECARGEVRPDMLLVMNPSGEKIQIPGEATHEPTFGLPAMWITEDYREEAVFKNYTVVDPPTVITTHITEVIKDNMADLLSYSETQKLLNDLDKEHQKLVADLVPAQITIGTLQRVLQNLLSEHISIRDLPGILEAIAEVVRSTSNIVLITEHVRARLARQICHQLSLNDGFLPLVTLAPRWEEEFAKSLSGNGEDRQLAMAPSKIQEFIGSVRKIFDELAMQGSMPVLLTSPMVRPYVRSIIERFRPSIVVLSQNEVHSKAKIKTLGQLG